MTVPPYDAGLISFCESKGLAKVRRLRHVENHSHGTDWGAVDKWISVKEAELRYESISIARKALSNSQLATKIAISAIVLSIIMAIQKLIAWSTQ